MKKCLPKTRKTVMKMEQNRKEEYKHFFPKHHTFDLEHNPHKSYYDTVEDWIKDNEPLCDDLPEEQRQEMISTNEVWYLHCYPNTPVGFFTIVGATFEYVMETWRGYEKEAT